MNKKGIFCMLMVAMVAATFAEASSDLHKECPGENPCFLTDCLPGMSCRVVKGEGESTCKAECFKPYTVCCNEDPCATIRCRDGYTCEKCPMIENGKPVCRGLCIATADGGKCP